MGNSRNSYLIKNTIIFTLGNLGSKLISFFLIPLYTNALLLLRFLSSIHLQMHLQLLNMESLIWLRQLEQLRFHFLL